MAKKTKKRTGSPVPTRVTKQKLLEGLPGPDSVRIRYAVPEEASTVTELLKTAADDLETGHLEALADGQCGTWLLDGLAGAGLTEPLVRAASAGNLRSAAGLLSLPLVARDRDGQVVGALLAVPSGTIISTVAQLPGTKPYALVSMLKYAKIKAVAVREDVRGRGIGAALFTGAMGAFKKPPNQRTVGFDALIETAEIIQFTPAADTVCSSVRREWSTRLLSVRRPVG